MANETKILTGMAKTTTGNVQASSFRDNASGDENGNECSENQQSAPIQKAKQHCQAADYFQPGQIKRQPDRHRPREQMVIIDINGKSSWIEYLNRSCVNKRPRDK